MRKFAKFLWEVSCILFQGVVIGWCIVWGVVGVILVYAIYISL